MHVALIGFMCSGKSTVGRSLAALLGVPFVDIDRVVEQRVGPLVPFFQQHGEEAFREQEHQVLIDVLQGPPSVIATGGGTPCLFDNMERMKQAGTVVWLDVPLDALMPRIERSGGDRPLLFGLKGEALRARVEELLAPREPVYAQADIIVQAAAPPQVVAERIAQALLLPQSR
ncbi:MAG: shikimate kinase [Flavobacteriales bacterium]|jgi:shikimate kinase